MVIERTFIPYFKLYPVEQFVVQVVGKVVLRDCVSYASVSSDMVWKILIFSSGCHFGIFPPFLYGGRRAGCTPITPRMTDWGTKPRGL